MDLAHTKRQTISVGVPIGIVFVVVLLVALFSANPVLSLGVVVSGVAVAVLLWRGHEPMGMLYAMGFHWLQASMPVIAANFSGLALSGNEYDVAIAPAIWLSLGGTVAVAAGLRLGAGKAASTWDVNSVIEIMAEISPRKLFLATLLAIAFYQVILRLAYILPGLTQPLLAFGLARWSLVLMLAYVVMTRGAGYGYLITIVVVEAALGFLGFFSDFKSVFVVVAIGALTAPTRRAGAKVWTLVGVMVIVLGLGIVWSGIKNDYRAFLNQGTGQQVVLVDISERAEKLSELVSDFDFDRAAAGTEALTERIGYVDYLAVVMERIPRYYPHEEGRLWGEAVGHALVPRLINPNKRIIDDSERTREFTGTDVAGAERGTSISLGYVAETYIDFGVVGMWPALLAWGVVLGLMYRGLLHWPRYRLLGFVSAPILVALSASTLEQSNLKMVTAVLLGFIALGMTTRFVGPAFLAFVMRPLVRRDA